MGSRTGTLVLVVGPSGAGKDTLLAGARFALADADRFVFAQRIVTRPSTGGIEQHQAISEREFQARDQTHDFLLSWHAHDTFYAVPGHYRADLAQNRTVIANVSRTVIDAAYGYARRVVVIRVTVPDEVRAARLIARGREDASDIAKRIVRDIPIASRHGDVIDIVNDGTVEAGVDRLVDALNRIAVSP